MKNMKMTIARALKEKNRIVGRIKQVLALISSENVRYFNMDLPQGTACDENQVKTFIEACDARRKVDVAALEAEWKSLEEKLVRVKLAIQKANQGALETLVRLQEAKSHIVSLSSYFGQNEQAVDRINAEAVRVTSVKFDKSYVLSEVEKYTNLVNELQDKIDEYNAMTQIELD